jgi:hypothetical protein
MFSSYLRMIKFTNNYDLTWNDCRLYVSDSTLDIGLSYPVAIKK